MDKQLIEEMEKDIEIRMAMAKGVAGSMNNGVEGWLAEYLIEKGWAKIPDGAVVLTKEELEERDCEKHHEGHRTGVAGMQEQVEALHTALNERNAELEEYVRKETAEKFAERVKMAFYYEFDELIPSIMADKIDEICKEITGEHNEKV